MSRIVPSIVGYPGGKNRYRDFIEERLWTKGIDTYAEPYGGSFGLGVGCTYYKRRIYNDIDPVM